MPLVRVHKASDGSLFENYADYVAHEEGIKFEANWNTHFPHEVEAFKTFVRDNADQLVKVIQASKVKHKGGKKP